MSSWYGCRITFVIAEIFLLAGAVANNIRTTGEVDEGVESQNEVSCSQVRKAVFAIAVAFTFLTVLFSVVYYVLQSAAGRTQQQWASYRGEADPYTGHDGPTIGMTAYN